MLSFIIVALLISIMESAVFAQTTFTPVDYNFPNGFGKMANNYTNYHTPNSSYSVELPLSASNGYGTWTYTTAGKWMLIGDTLTDESTTNSLGSQPSGILAAGDIPFPNGHTTNRIKVAANLNGSVRYVWVDPQDNHRLFVGGFDDHSTGRNINGTDLSGLNSHATNARELTGTMHVSQSMYIKNSAAAVIDYQQDDDWRDVLDISMDSKYLYIAFCFKDFTGGGILPIFRVYTFVVDLATYLPLEGEYTIENENGTSEIEPKLFQVNGTGGGGTFNGRRPTVAANVRNNDVPQWDVAYIKYASADGNNPEQWLHVSYVKMTHKTGMQNSQTAYYHSVPENSQNIPVTATFFPPAYHVPFGNDEPVINPPTYGQPTHARIVNGSIEAPNQTSVVSLAPSKCIYVITDASMNNQWNGIKGGNLFYNRIIPSANGLDNITDRAYYIDGFLPGYAGDLYTASRVSPMDRTYLTSGNPNPKKVFYEVIDEPIVAFANPYDGQKTTTYDEFHCVYRLIGEFSATTHHDPILMIVNGCNTGFTSSARNNSDASLDSRMVINRTRSANNTNWTWMPSPKNTDGNHPSTYTASVNQMGIHVFYEGDSNGDLTFECYYKRDSRAFDEDIEENTLVTNKCYVTDGTSHGGQVGATLLPNKFMTLWTDPNFNNSALYTRSSTLSDYWNNANLFIYGNAALNIGNNTTDASPNAGATLNLPPNFEIKFLPTSTSDVPRIAINAASNLQYYGIPYTGTEPSVPLVNFHGRGKISILGNTGAGQGFLNLHGGSVFQIPNDVTFVSSKGNLNVFYEHSAIPFNNSLNPNAASFIDIYGTASLTNNTILQNKDNAGNLFPTGNSYVWRALVCKPLMLTASTPPPIAEWYVNYPQTQLTFDNVTVQSNNSNLRLEVSCNADVSISSSAQNRAVLTTEPNPPTSGMNTKPTTSLANLRSFDVENSTFSRSTFYAANPSDVPNLNNVHLYNNTFSNTINFGVYLHRNNTEDYHNIDIDNCHFNGGANSCFIEGFDQPLEWVCATTDDNIQVQCNRVNVINSSFNSGAVALHSNNSNIGIGNNTITGSGIGIKQTFPSGAIQNKSFFCNNTITYCNTGMELDNWYDYIKLTSIANCGLGLLSKDGVDGLFVFSSIKNCTSQGILLAPTNSTALCRQELTGTFNSIELNNLNNTATPTAQIEIRPGGKIRVRHNNNIIRQDVTDNPKDDKFIYYNDPSNSTATIPIGFNNSTNDDKVDKMYWSSNNQSATSPYLANAYTPYSIATINSLDPYISHITYSDGSLESGHTGLYTTLLPYCSSGIPQPLKPHEKSNHTESIINDTSLEHCQELAITADNYKHNGQYELGYEGFKSYMESCAYLSNSYNSFIDITTCNTNRSGDKIRFQEYREWLKKVLYYNLDTLYYCTDANAMRTTFYLFNDPRKGLDFKGLLAVERYIIQSGKCPGFAKDTIAAWDACHNIWQDTVSDPPAAPFDSTLPTLEDLDLGILRGPNSGIVAFNNAVIGPVISNLRALENPFTSETTIAFDCREAVALKFEVYDILGKKVYDGGSHIYDRGANKLVLSGDGLASGILYARFSNPIGFVSTLKLRHR